MLLDSSLLGIRKHLILRTKDVLSLIQFFNRQHIPKLFNALTRPFVQNK